ncbi:MAG: penicillin-binding protein 2 [Alphaproteobacteria bacterium GM202ARS2]|nr:penicillin-binding protein 2 [Alphaproteobacteria bacterium GM202ARS2]
MLNQFWLDGRQRDGLRRRLVLFFLLTATAFAVVVGRLVFVFWLYEAPHNKATGVPDISRGSIYDRGGYALAVSLPAVSVYVHPYQVKDKLHVAQTLAALFPSKSAARWLKKLQSPRAFVWIKRHLTPRQHERLLQANIADLHIMDDEQRVYPQDSLVSHVVGFTDIDQRGLAGIERGLDEYLAQGEDVVLTLDMRFQGIMRAVLQDAVERYRPQGVTGVLLSAEDSDVMAMVSLPDFDANHVGASPPQARFHQAAHGVYELGSLLKLFTVAHALEQGVDPYERRYDTKGTFFVDDLEVKDDHLDEGVLSLAQVLTYSSNIGSAQMALLSGMDAHLGFLRRFHFMESLPIVLRERGFPLYPSVWQRSDWVSTSYGYGLALSPLHLAAGVAALVNGGLYRSPRFVHSMREQVVRPRYSVVSSHTSLLMRRLMRDAVLYGTGKAARDHSVSIGGKTGTAKQWHKGTYHSDRLVVSFVAAFPIEAPVYVLLVVLDRPSFGGETAFNGVTGGDIAAPLVKTLAQRFMALVPYGRDGSVEEVSDGTF